MNVPIFVFKTFGFGVGAGNVGYYMENFATYDTYGTTDVHNWWLEILGNYGIAIFVGYVLFYGYLLVNLYKARHFLTSSFQRMSCEAFLVALVAFPISSLSSSSILGILPQWMFFGFALAFLNTLRRQMGATIAQPRRTPALSSQPQ